MTNEEFGLVSRFLLDNPPVAIASGAVGTALVIAFILRVFRNEVRSASLDKASSEILKSVREDNTTLRELLKESEKAREELRRAMQQEQLNLANRLATMSASIDTLTEQRNKLEHDFEQLKIEARDTATEKLKLEMQVSGQLATIEQLAVKVKRLDDELSLYKPRP